MKDLQEYRTSYLRRFQRSNQIPVQALLPGMFFPCQELLFSRQRLGILFHFLFLQGRDHCQSSSINFNPCIYCWFCRDSSAIFVFFKELHRFGIASQGLFEHPSGAATPLFICLVLIFDLCSFCRVFAVHRVEEYGRTLQRIEEVTNRKKFEIWAFLKRIKEGWSIPWIV